jgi:hypothetical protein
MRRADAVGGAHRKTSAGTSLWPLPAVLLARRLRMVAAWDQPADYDAQGEDLGQTMNLTRCSFRYSGLFAFTTILFQVL